MAQWFNIPDRTDWRQCKEEFSVEERLARELRLNFFKYDSVL